MKTDKKFEEFITELHGLLMDLAEAARRQIEVTHGPAVWGAMEEMSKIEKSILDKVKTYVETI